MDNGWIKIHRKLLEWEWYTDINVKVLFIHLLLKANHKPKSYRGIVIETGQVMTGLELLSKETGLSVQNVRTALKRLKSTNELTNKTSSKGTIIQLVNYAKYQIVTNELTNKQQTTNKQVTTNKNVKKEKKVYIPTKREFLLYAKEKDTDFELKKKNIALKYESWVENGWKDGYNKPIKNWKSKLINNLQYISKEYKQKSNKL